MVNPNKVNKFETKQFNKTAGNNTRGASGNSRGVGSSYKKGAHGKPAFIKSSEFQKKERAKKFQERQDLRAQKQKELAEERAKAKQEKEKKILQYKKKRLEKTKAISKRTNRGQPLMKDRMQLLLKQIQEMKRS